MNTRPRKMVLQTGPLWVFPLVGLVPVVIALGVIAVGPQLGIAQSDTATAVMWSSVIGAITAALLLALAAVATFQEVSGIHGVRANPWVTWCQYADEEAWYQEVEADWQAEQASAGIPWTGLILLPVIDAAVSWFTISYVGAPVAIIAPITALLGLLWVVILVIHAMERISGAARYQARRMAPPPSVLISKWGVYDEDAGYRSLFWLKAVRLHTTNTTTLTMITHNPFHSRNNGSDKQVISLRIPAGAEAEAAQLVQRFTSERHLAP